MSDKKQNFLEEEFRASNVYKTISQSGGNAADKIADGIGRATDAMGSAFAAVDKAIGNHAPRGGFHPYRPNDTNADFNAAKGEDDSRQSGSQSQPGGYQQPYVKPGGSSSQNYGSHVNQQSRPPYQQNYRTNPVPPVGTNSAGEPRVVQPNDVQVKMVRKQSNVKYYFAGIAALIYANNMPLYSLWHFLIFGAVVAGAFFLGKSMFKGKKKYVAVPVDKPVVDEVSEPEKTGNSAVDKTIEEGYEYLKRLRMANDAILDEDMSDCIDRIEKSSAGIFAYIATHPDKVSQIRKFMNYYLPTTMKLLDSYQRLNAESYKGDNIKSTLNDIDRVLYTVAGAFEKQLDSLYADEAMDISTDISVFESMLQQEGFISEEKKSQTK